METKASPRVAVVSGGPSAEAEVSRVSGRGVADALRLTYSNVAFLELDTAIGDALRENRTDVVFPVLHGPPGEDGTFQGFLETLGLSYVGSGVRASACAMDKIVAKHLFQGAGLPVARDIIVQRSTDASAEAERIVKDLGSIVVVKPSRQGSALGVRFANGHAEIEAALIEAFRYDDQVLVEERVEGREITVAILERDGIEALPVLEVRTPSDSWYDFEHRYTQGLSEHIIPAPLPANQYRQTQELAIRAHAALGCRDYSRVDFVVPEAGDPVVLEVNTLPGMTPTSLYPDIAEAAGFPFQALVALLVERAWARGQPPQ
ncbi:MAG: D-alanine--D-alanine ligase [Gemmatimonas sp.]|nr:D-alanine--D-alanine ligase [Gemmatimonas sp.]